MAKPILVLNGPTLNLLGVREPHIYGRQTLADIEQMAKTRAMDHKLALEFRQTNHEGVFIDWILGARGTAEGLIVNAGAWTHTSIAIHDALKACELPIVEVHLSNPYAREAFRHKSYVSAAAMGVICGFGGHGYVLAVDALATAIAKKQSP